MFYIMNEIKKEQPRTHMRMRDGANQLPAAENLIDSFDALKRAWVAAGGGKMEFERRAASIWTEWMNMSKVKRAYVFGTLNKAAVSKTKPENWKDNPLFFILDYPEPRPTNYNGCRTDPPAPVHIAKYDGEWGMYTEEDILLFNLETKKQS